MLETYLGEALAWEADELGHLNMRYYFERAEQARAFLFASLGLPLASKLKGTSALQVQTQHIHYLKELRPGMGMKVQTGILDLGERDACLLHMITQTPDIISAIIVETLSHVSKHTLQPFAWPKRTLSRAQDFMVSAPPQAKPRNIDPDEPPGQPSMQAADALELPVIGRGMFSPQDCDVFGFVKPSSVIGRASDSAQHLKSAWPDLDFSSDAGMSGALLEGRALHRNRPRAGDIYVLRSGLRAAGTNTRELCHWILDPVSGKCWSSFVATACRFNLKTRRLVKIDDEMLLVLQSASTKGLHA